MARKKPDDDNDEPTLPLSTAREAARVELLRWQHAYDVLAVAASVEDQEAASQRRITTAERAAEAAEAAHRDALARLTTEREGAQAIADAVVAKTREEIDQIHAEKSAVVAAGREEIATVQAALVQIGRDEDAAKQAKAEYAGLLAEVQALRTERDALVAKLTR